MDPSLYRAAADGEIEPFKVIAKEKLGSIVTHNKINTVLHVNIASQKGKRKSTEFVKQILEMCPSLLVQVNAKGDAPLHVAAKCGNDVVVEFLIEFAKKQPKEPESGVETAIQMLGMTNEEQNTALHEAVRYCSPDVVKILMKTEPDFPYSANGSGQTPLYMAAARGSREMVDDILKNCPLAAHEGPSGKNALHAAVDRYSQDVVTLLLEKKKNLTRERDQYGWTPLHQSAYLGYTNITTLLIKNDKSSALILDKDRKMTALHLAASQGHYWTVEEIIHRCPECYDLVDYRGWNFLHYAMISSNSEELDYIQEKHPFIINLINDKDENGNTPLHLFAAVTHVSDYGMLFWSSENDYGAVNDQNISVKYILHYGNPELEEEIRKLSKDVGRGQYPDGVIKITTKRVIQEKKSDWKLLDQHVIGMKEAKDSHLVVAALIATVTFAAGFTLPGGYKNEDDDPNQGTAILSKNAAFQAFVISDAIAMVLSLSAVFVHFILSLKFFQKYIFLFVFALAFTLVAMAAMVLAFVTGTYAMLAPSLGLAIVTCIIGLTFFSLVLFLFYKVLTKALKTED